jgi:hypothetical protein
MSASPPLDSLGRRRSPAAVAGYLAGRPARSKGRRYPADPPRTEEIIAVMRCCGERPHGLRARGLIVVLWRRACVSRERSTSPSSTSTPGAARCSCAAARAATVARSAWTTGASTSSSRPRPPTTDDLRQRRAAAPNQPLTPRARRRRARPKTPTAVQSVECGHIAAAVDRRLVGASRRGGRPAGR